MRNRNQRPVVATCHKSTDYRAVRSIDYTSGSHVGFNQVGTVNRIVVDCTPDNIREMAAALYDLGHALHKQADDDNIPREQSE